MADVQILRVKAAHPDRVGLWDKNPSHPGGEVWVAGDREVEVADTTEVRRALQEKRIVEVRTAPGGRGREEPESRAPAETDKPGPTRRPDNRG